MPPNKKGKKGKLISFSESNVEDNKRDEQEKKFGEDLRDLNSTPVWGSREQNDEQKDIEAKLTRAEQQLEADRYQNGFNNGPCGFQESKTDTKKLALPIEQSKRVVKAEQGQEALFDKTEYTTFGAGPRKEASELFFNKAKGSSFQQPYPPQHPPQQQQQQPFAPPTEHQQYEGVEAEEQYDEDL
jgi:hypothetical protein